MYYSLVYNACRRRCHADGCASVKVPHSGAAVSTGGCVPSCALGGPANGTSPRDFPLPLRFFRWNCESDCKYRCMQTLQTVRLSEGLKQAKYYGKWSFRRVLGAQEIVSSVGSLVNAAVHVRYIPLLFAAAVSRASKSKSKSKSPSPSPPPESTASSAVVATLWSLHAVVSVNGWVWSAVFHARDTKWTEYMDYASANAMFFYALFASVVRVGAGGEGEGGGGSGRGRAAWRRYVFIVLVAAVTLTLLVLHVRRATGGMRYDYDFNMRVMIISATCHWVILLTWAYAYRPWWWKTKANKAAKVSKAKRTEGIGEEEGASEARCGAAPAAAAVEEANSFPYTNSPYTLYETPGRRRAHPGRHVLALCCATYHVAALAEVLDFPPLWGLLDAHGLWHCATPVCIWLWYKFVKADLSLTMKTKRRKTE